MNSENALHKKRKIFTPAERNLRIKLEKNKATEVRLIKEISRPKILIEQIPDPRKPASYYLDLAKKKFLNLQESKSTRSINTLESKIWNNSSKSRNSPNRVHLPIVESNTKPNDFIPEWLLSRPDFKEACKAMEIEEQERIPFILDINHHNRSEEDKKLMQNYLLSIKFFKDLPISIVLETGNKLLKEKYKEGEKIIEKGDAADCLLIIYKGKASVYLDSEKIAEKIEGDVVGELALDSRALRSADVIADTNCIVFKLMWDDYEAAIMNLKRKEKHENISFLNSISFFENWSKLKLLRISSLMNYKCFAKGSVIYERGNPGNLLYFIKSGFVDIFAYVPMEHYNKWPTSNNEWRIHQINREYLVEIASLTSKQYFGENELIINGKRTMKAIAKTEVNCLILNKDHFFENFTDNEILVFKEMGYVKLPELKDLQEKVLNDLSSRFSSQKAILDALKVNFINLEGREYGLDEKRKKLNPWLGGYKKRRTESAESLKKKIVCENSRNISVARTRKGFKVY